MDPLSLIASCVSIVDGIEKIYKFAKENIHSSTSVRNQLSALISRCCACKGLIEGIKLQAELDKDNTTRLFLLDHVAEPIQALEKAIKLMTDKMGKIPRHVVFGKSIDNSMDSCLKTFDNTLRILQLALQVDQFTIVSTLREDVRDVKDSVQSIHVVVDQLSRDLSDLKLHASEEQLAQQIQRADDAKRELVAWIPHFDPAQLCQVLAEKSHPGTGSWFLDGILDQWWNSAEKSSRVLWLQGRSGAGKSTLITSAIAFLSKQKRVVALAYFFCAISLSHTRSLVSILGSMLIQICDQKRELWHAVKAWRDDLADRQQGMLRKPNPEEIGEIFRKVCSNFDEVVLVLDAPNECEHPKKVLIFIGDLLQRIPCLRILISSTPDMESMWLKCTDITTVTMSLTGVRSDIEDCIRARMDDDEQLQGFPQYLKERILTKLLERADGSFRWAECQLSEIIENATSEAGVDSSLENLSSSLEELYSSVLESIPTPQTKMLRRALMWLTFAIRPMKIDELREVMVLEENDKDIDQSQRLLPGKAEALIAKCRMLVDYDASSRRVSLAHSSVQDFLLSDSCRTGRVSFFHLDRDSSLCLLTCLAVGYLNCDVLSHGYTSSKSDLQERLVVLPLARYAATSWPIFSSNVAWHHNLYQSQTETALKKFFDSYVRPQGGSFGAWIELYDPIHLHFVVRVGKDIPLSTPLYYAARRGWVEIVSMILRVYGTQHLETHGGSRVSTPLHVAAAYGRCDVVKILLEHGADPNECNDYGERGVAWAEEHGYPDIVNLYYQYNAKPITDRDRARVSDITFTRWQREKHLPRSDVKDGGGSIEQVQYVQQVPPE